MHSMQGISNRSRAKKCYGVFNTCRVQGLLSSETSSPPHYLTRAWARGDQWPLSISGLECDLSRLMRFVYIRVQQNCNLGIDPLLHMPVLDGAEGIRSCTITTLSLSLSLSTR
ncbi:hypothetical protein GOP47_0018246 [Adiantum capillus-veneris]|uniref:Uncharacterized protein n=1 Tax=Adiantum capillus-veneris TaxID=13818 RepID=A0A9D4Z9Y7_ADICA|nr:hypothetical protein GOP47_0018246 [Adiantum capillus-veneris]